MILKLNGSHDIENLRHYPAESVDKLRALLALGTPAIPDPHRKDFYDVQNGDRVFYIHLCPSGRVLLLAAWRKNTAHMPVPGRQLVAEACASR